MKQTQSENIVEKVVNFIAKNGSASEPISNHHIASHFNTNEVNIRKYINQARCEGIPVCSCGKGYYYSTDKANILDTIQSLNNRTIAVERAISGLLNALNDELVGVENADNGMQSCRE